MKKSDFFFDLPPELIAQTPIEPRDHSRLLHLDRFLGELSHHHFYDLPDLLKAGDVLIVNDSRVLPARLYGDREDTGAHIEVVLLEQKQIDLWEVLVRPGKKAKPGHVLVFGDGILRGEIVDVLEGGNRLIRFTHEGNFYDVIDHIGQMPLPPYIKEKLQDKERYQTVYSKEVGSAAAPTAGLHFTKDLMKTLTERGIKIGYVTLHVGLGTFRPVKVENIEEHKMHSERYYMPEATARLIREAKEAGNRVIAVGTTSCRTLESVAQKYGDFKECSGSTDIFIYPGYTFQAIDGLITNFHLPESTLIMLVSAFAGYDHVMKAYEEAVREKYRFFSFGDAMLII